ncbi:hypothetical protein JD844_005725 [Phrynosoma platyrhinos]|uniref:G-protein coupled receptors family 1 profile domain-containing protein n=1 Tax=Phrynosoma platyrhinos TaxID=52577 RepID=A0ABQ7TNL6_PHRPL|nr:hypothetical protein JD844_005725 [Phrynosoma platyrhinos]
MNASCGHLNTTTVEDAMRHIAIVTNVIILVLGVSGNGLVMWVIAMREKRKTFTSICYFNLAVADFLFSLGRIPALVQEIMYSCWPFGLVLCKLHAFTRYLTVFASVFILTVISVYRCLLIARPVWARNHRGPHCQALMCIGAWVLALAFSIPYLVVRHTEVRNGGTYCVYQKILKKSTDLPLRLSRFFGGFLVPFIVISSAYLVLVFKLRGRRWESSHRTFALVAIIVALFFICWLPHHIFVFLSTISSTKETWGVALKLTNALAYLHSCVNPVLYCFVGYIRIRGLHRQTSFLGLFRKALTEEDEGSAGAEVSQTFSYTSLYTVMLSPVPTQLPPSLFRSFLTYFFSSLLLAVILASYSLGYQLLKDSLSFISLSFYGAFLSLHILSQSCFAYLELRKHRRTALPCRFTKKVALTISAYQEDPSYLRQCLVSIRDIDYPKHLLSVVMVIDGNNPEDQYMMKMFEEVFCREDLGTYVWKNNYHTCPTVDGEAEDLEKQEVEALIQTRRCVCIMQKWGGKREVMYTAFKALKGSADYIQVCDSDTKLDPRATVEMVKVLESDKHCGAVGGDVRILNLSDSYISFMSSLRYWMAFNIERACQSFFNCVSCISGPLGMYRNDLLQQILELWYHQTFLGIKCTYGDDRHLTNRILSLGYATKYAPNAICHTETPSHLLRWLAQQTRWSRSYFREWLLMLLWWPRHSLWMAYESIVSGFFPFLVAGTTLRLLYYGSMWAWLWLLICIQLSGLVKALIAAIFRQNPIMLLASLYSALYMAALLPTKLFALVSLPWAGGWGTSGRHHLRVNYLPLFPLLVWWGFIGGGLALTLYKEAVGGWHDHRLLVYGFSACSAHWVILLVLYVLMVRRVWWHCHGVYRFDGVTKGWDNGDLGIPGTYKPIIGMGVKLEELQNHFV